jgi:hypothetical protein
MKVIPGACLCLITYAATAPVVPPSSVVNNASFATGTTALAPGTIAAIFGSTWMMDQRTRFHLLALTENC